MKLHPTPNRPLDDGERTVYDALRHGGHLLPTTASEVEASEKAGEPRPRRPIPTPLPEYTGKLARRVRAAWASDEDAYAADGLARAARNGAELLPETEEAMRRDRDRAEREDVHG